jgi:hypothetical protein
LHLLKRPARFYSLMLTHITHDENSIVWLKTIEKLMHLLRTRQAGFIEYVQVPGSFA